MDFELENFFSDAKKEIIIIGIVPLLEQLNFSARNIGDFLNVRKKLDLKILYESDQEIYNQSLLTGSTYNKENRISYSQLKVKYHRVAGVNDNKGLKEEISEYLNKTIEDSDQMKSIMDRVFMAQINLRMPLNIIKADNRIWFSYTTNSVPRLDDYEEILAESSSQYKRINDLIDYYFSLNTRDFFSKPQDELIWIYDKELSIPRCIAPRSAFYTTDFQRKSVWGFIFNRNGELLLQKRSKSTKDNRLLWDKSCGGHVDVKDTSSLMTAKRELIEELFLPQAEYTKYLREDLGDIVNFGDWNPKKRSERHFHEAFNSLLPSDWVIFSPTNDFGIPLTSTRVSPRRITEPNGGLVIKSTIFSSDIYFFVAPEGYMDTTSQMKKLVALGEKEGAASDHQLISINKLSDWIMQEKSKQEADSVFTDDLLHIEIQFKSILESFSEFLKYLHKIDKISSK